MYFFLQAVSPSDKSKAFNLRYQVYCSEKRWLEKSNYPDEIEYDREDERSAIFLAVDKATGQAVGTVRLIINAHSGWPLPIAWHPSIKGSISTENCVEISRLSILPNARKGDVFVGLIKLLFLHVISNYSNSDSVFFSVEQRFLNIVNQLGFDFTPLASSALWYGDYLIPSRQKIKSLESSIKRKNPHFYGWLWDNPETMNRNKRLVSFFKAGQTDKQYSAFSTF
ncbi:MAG: N-acyl amino acid synthase FeeM domain-containing protein [Paludibacteraceae bacterium]